MEDLASGWVLHNHGACWGEIAIRKLNSPASGPTVSIRRTGRGLEFLFSLTLSVRFHVRTASGGRLIEDRLEKPLP